MSQLTRALDRLRYERMRRGRGARALDALLGRLHAGEVEMDEETRDQLAMVIESAVYEMQDRAHEAQSNLRVTGRTIAQAVRRGLG